MLGTSGGSAHTLQGSPVVVQCEAAPNADWSKAGPAALGGRMGGFAVRWSARIVFKAGTYVFTTEADGQMLSVDGVQLVARWGGRGWAVRTSRVRLTQGYHVLKFEAIQRARRGPVHLSWDALAPSALHPAAAPDASGI